MEVYFAQQTVVSLGLMKGHCGKQMIVNTPSKENFRLMRKKVITLPLLFTRFNVRESLEQGSNSTTLTGFFDVHSNTKHGYIHYYIYNGTLTSYPEELTMILQGKVLPKRT
jgi:hypothetical protein